jgi:hypothetical protein
MLAGNFAGTLVRIMMDKSLAWLYTDDGSSHISSVLIVDATLLH